MPALKEFKGLLSMQSKELNTGYQTYTCMPIFTEALFTGAKGGNNLNVHQR
jgi:hypothetical protein